MRRRYQLILVALLCLATPGSIAAQPWGPWSVSTDAPALLTSADRERPPLPEPDHSPSVAATPFVWLLDLHRRYITRIDGDRCPMYPTCSQYSVQAIHRHGPLMGVVMTVDRLMHEADEQQYAYRIKVGNRFRYEDPVEANDFWWYRP